MPLDARSNSHHNPCIINTLRHADDFQLVPASSEFLQFDPYLRPTLWGGRNLARFGKRLPPKISIGESWEVSGHPLHVSLVADGDSQGRSLTELWSAHAADWTAGEYRPGEPFPLLVKLLDCRLPCSVQVHPDQPASIDPHQHVKTEAWTVLEAAPGARIFAGLKHGVTSDELRAALASDAVIDCLNGVEPKIGDCFLITPGTVHTMQGVVLAEFQTSSDATLRLYDWNRIDVDGKPRTIHVAESLAAIDWSRGPVAPVSPRRLKSSTSDVISEALVEIPEFTLTRHTVHGKFEVERSEMFAIWMLVSGSATISSVDHSQPRPLHAGDTLLIPPSNDPLAIDSQGPTPAVMLECHPTR